MELTTTTVSKTHASVQWPTQRQNSMKN